MKILKYYPNISAKLASHLNFAASTIAGLIFIFVAANLSNLNPYAISMLLLTGMIVDAATVPYVHSGVISERYKNMKYSDIYLKVHVPPATIGYISMFLFIVSQVFGGYNILFYIFAVCWIIVYLSGAYAYIKVRQNNN